MIRLRYSPEVNFGHVMQAVVLLLTVGGGAVTSYISLRNDIADLRVSIGVQLAADEARLAEAELRLTLDDAAIKKLGDDDGGGRARIQGEIDKVADQISDLRLKIAQSLHLR
jgi:hypothetical protein